MKTTKDFWRENLLSSYYIHKQTKQVHQTGGNGENANNRAHQSKVQTTKQRERAAANPCPTSESKSQIFTTHLGIIKEKEEEERLQ